MQIVAKDTFCKNVLLLLIQIKLGFFCYSVFKNISIIRNSSKQVGIAIAEKSLR